MRALGIPPLSQTFFRTLPMHERKSKGSKKKVCEDDDEYLPPMDDNLLSSSSEDDNDDLEEDRYHRPVEMYAVKHEGRGHKDW
ncbi:uncharacterized protein A4U43_C05F13240 [Asparagus officinalis]|uniref:Uncharacterized protein n=1 Tax=Asparagus officinalis TaxID=4686 RepID=A0A5P1ERC0_ASPOF|nr:uncharacterized protein A4U43_C05F13240 [Asparagus officinalis]